jgi:hypothetical protein
MGDGTTSERGYGWDHQEDRARQLAELRANPGQPCPRCGQSMYPDQRLDLGHRDDLATYGTDHPSPRRLEHARCNRRAGQALGAARRSLRKSKTSQPRSRNW